MEILRFVSTVNLARRTAAQIPSEKCTGIVIPLDNDDTEDAFPLSTLLLLSTSSLLNDLLLILPVFVGDNFRSNVCAIILS